MGGAAFARLERAVLSKRSPLVLGLDPRPDAMPAAYQGEEGGIVRFHARLIELLAEHVVGIKPQIAFFERLGTRGLELYEATCTLARDHDLVVIGDVKRGDIGSTAAAYAEAHFGWADILTINPYLGDDAVEPFLDWCRERGKGVFVLCVTSNQGWKRLQGLTTQDGRPVYLHVAEAIREWNATCPQSGRWGPVGAVVGGTHPEVLHAVREVLDASWLLLPGVGAQGASIEDLAPAFGPDGSGVVVPVSRGLASCFDPGDGDWESRVTASAERVLAEIRASVPALGGS